MHILLELKEHKAFSSTNYAVLVKHILHNIVKPQKQIKEEE
jgi:hypothetical protein